MNSKIIKIIIPATEYFMVIALFFLMLSGCTTLNKTAGNTPKGPDILPKKGHKVLIEPTKPNVCYFLLSEFSKREGNIDKAASYMDKAISSDPDSLFLQKETAKINILKNDIPKALEIIEKGIKAHPENVDFLGVLAQIKLIQKKDAEVPPIFEKIISINPEDQSVYFLLGGLYSKMNDTTKAIDTFKRLVIKFPDSFSGHYYLGRLYTVEEKYDKAATELQESYRLNPDLIEALYALVQIYEINHNQNKLLEIYKTILEKDPEDIRASLALAILYHQNKNEVKATLILNDLGKRSDQDPEILKQVARYYIKKALYSDSIYLLNGMLKSTTQQGDLYYFTGVCQNESKNLTEAMAMFEKVPVTSKYYNKSVLIRAFHAMDTGNNYNAIEILEDALKKSPNNTEFILYLGSFYEEEEMYQKAVATYLRGLAIDKNSTRLYFRLGVAYDKKGDRTSCIKEMKNVIRLDPEDANALNYLGYTYADLGMNLEEAEDLIMRAMKFKPDDGYITDSLGWVYYKKGNYNKAITTLEKANTLVPNDPILLEHLGDAFFKALDNEKALEYYKRSLKNKKKNTEGLEIKIERLKNKQAILTP